MKFNLIFIFLIISLKSIWSFDLGLSLLDNNEYLRRGKITKVILKTSNPKLIQELKNKSKDISLNQWLYLLSVEFIQNGAKGESTLGSTVILKEMPPNKEVEFNLSDQKYTLSFGEVKFHPDDAMLKPQGSIFKEIYNLQQFLLWLQDNLKVIFVSIVFIGSGLIVLIVRVRQKRLKAKKLKLLKSTWLEKLKNATTRVEIEKIYQAKREWSKFYTSDAIDDFLKYLNTIQYSPEWTSTQSDQLRQKLEKMKQSLT